jgi:outer membrane protein OmpA-like peptidoglycan-associated protein
LAPIYDYPLKGEVAVANRKTILTLMMAVAMGMTLGGCADLNNAFKRTFHSEKDSGKVVYVSPATDGTTVSFDDPTLPTGKQDLSYNRLAGQYSNDSVELFSLDEPGRPMRNMSFATPGIVGSSAYGTGGVPSSTDPSVTVFPFGDSVLAPGTNPAYRPYGGARRPMPAAGGYAAMDSLPMYTGNPNTVYFEHGSSALSATARKAIASAARNYGGQVVVEGHASQRAQSTDPVQRGIINLQMSMKRAMAVTKQLIRDGVPPESIKTTAYGSAKPAVMETDRATEAKNRRVEILTGLQ